MHAPPTHHVMGHETTWKYWNPFAVRPLLYLYAALITTVGHLSSRLLWHFDDFISRLNFKRLCGNAPVSLLQYMFWVSGSPYKLPKVATVRIRSYRKLQQSVFVPILNVATVGICTYWKLQQSSSKITLAPWKHVKLIHYLSSHVITHVFYLIYQ